MALVLKHAEIYLQTNFVEDFALINKYQIIKNHSVKTNFILITRKRHSPQTRSKIPPFTKSDRRVVIYIKINNQNTMYICKQSKYTVFQ